ncbi:hypothetical protein Tco_0997409, partial [Tanacetum coccineum]
TLFVTFGITSVDEKTSVKAAAVDNDVCNPSVPSYNTIALASGFVRSTAMDKLHVWKANIPRTLEITESEIDSRENNLKLLTPDVGGSCPSPAAKCCLPTDPSGKNMEENAGPTE